VFPRLPAGGVRGLPHIVS